MPDHVPAAHQSEHRLALIARYARRAAEDVGAPVDRRTVGLLAEIAEQAQRVIASASPDEPPAVDAEELEALAALIDRIDRGPESTQ